MRLLDLDPDFYTDRINLLNGLTGTLWEKATAEWFDDWQHSAELSADEVLAQAYGLEVLCRIYAAGLSNNADFYNAYQKQITKKWENFAAQPVAEILQVQLAEKLLQGLRPNDSHVHLMLGDGTKIIGPVMLQGLIAQGRRVLLYFPEENLQNLIFAHVTKDGLQTLAQDYLAARGTIDGDLKVKPLAQDNVTVPEMPDVMQQWQILTRPFEKRRMSDAIQFCLSYLPNKLEAEMDGLDFDTYARVFFEACDQPWEQIFNAHEFLITKLNAGKTLRFTNSDGTDLTVGINGFSFINCMLAVNIPGSEVYSAPELHSANGRVVMADSASPHDSGVVKHITLELKDGYLVSWQAKEGQEILDRVFAIDEGARYIGEVAIGTNPHLRRPFFSGLLNEKVSGSFHVAFGASYDVSLDEQGRPVKVFNGNESALHWDITTMLYGRNGAIEIDGVPIMQNGLFLDKELDVLNRGWDAVPVDQRPEHWRDYSGAFTLNGYQKV